MPPGDANVVKLNWDEHAIRSKNARRQSLLVQWSGQERQRKKHKNGWATQKALLRIDVPSADDKRKAVVSHIQSVRGSASSRVA